MPSPTALQCDTLKKKDAVCPRKIRQQLRILLARVYLRKDQEGGIQVHRQLQMEPEGSPLRKEHKIEAQVWAAQKDPASADALIGQYMPFIRSETFKFTHAAPEAGHEDELNIAATAFYEAALSYQRGRGAFLPYASTAIRNRLIDFYRVEQRHSGLVPLETPAGGGWPPAAGNPARQPG